MKNDEDAAILNSVWCVQIHLIWKLILLCNFFGLWRCVLLRQ